MKQAIKDMLWVKYVKHNRHLNIPGIYRHFKETKDGEDMIYAVSNVSIPISPKDMLEISENEECEVLMFHHTEMGADTWIHRVGDLYYHSTSIEKDMLVIYTALYADRKTYVRPFEMFISKVDKFKYPNVNQTFRLEEVK